MSVRGIEWPCAYACLCHVHVASVCVPRLCFVIFVLSFCTCVCSLCMCLRLFTSVRARSVCVPGVCVCMFGELCVVATRPLPIKEMKST